MAQDVLLPVTPREIPEGESTELVRELERANHRLEQANARIRRELHAAARVQQALLPASHFRVPGLDLAWRLRPCEELAGDLLNCLRLDEHQVAFFVMDVSGHGVSSAMLSVQVSRLISPLMSDSVLCKEPLKEPPWYRIVEPRQVIERLNTRFPMDTSLSQYFTFLYGVLDPRSGHVRFASAGHPGPIHVPAQGQARALTCRSHPVGFFEDSQIAEGRLVLEPGDRMWLYSDGMTESEDPEGRELGLAGLTRQLEQHRTAPIAQAADRTLESVERWCDPAGPADDCTLMGIEMLRG